MSDVIDLFENYWEENSQNMDAGVLCTPVDNLLLFRSDRFVERMPLLYDLGLIYIFRGHKYVYGADELPIRYDQDKMLIITSPIPLDCETHASKEHPLVGLTIKIDMALLLEVVGQVRSNSDEPLKCSKERTLAVVDIDTKIKDALARLMAFLSDPIDSAVLAPGVMKELLYYAVLGPGGDGLIALATDSGNFSTISKSLRFIHEKYTENISVDTLTNMAGMSHASFHRAFKKVAGDTPLQYLKKIRLHKAKELLATGNQKANSVAYEVGYESPSQFSREFKRFFGVSPSTL